MASIISAGTTSALAAYAEMVLADRDLRLSGYNILRFGANELVWTTAPELVESFFDRLFQLNIIDTFSGPS